MQTRSRMRFHRGNFVEAAPATSLSWRPFSSVANLDSNGSQLVSRLGKGSCVSGKCFPASFLTFDFDMSSTIAFLRKRDTLPLYEAASIREPDVAGSPACLSLAGRRLGPLESFCLLAAWASLRESTGTGQATALGQRPDSSGGTGSSHLNPHSAPLLLSRGVYNN